jgi:hypothetical protein
METRSRRPGSSYRRIGWLDREGCSRTCGTQVGWFHLRAAFPREFHVRAREIEKRSAARNSRARNARDSVRVDAIKPSLMMPRMDLGGQRSKSEP